MSDIKLQEDENFVCPEIANALAQDAEQMLNLVKRMDELQVRLQAALVKSDIKKAMLLNDQLYEGLQLLKKVCNLG